MIEDILEYSNDCAEKQSKDVRPTYRMVEKQMKGFPEELINYVYHYMNGRTEEATSYYQEWEYEQEQIKNRLFNKPNEQVENEIISNDNIKTNIYKTYFRIKKLQLKMR